MPLLAALQSSLHCVSTFASYVRHRGWFSVVKAWRARGAGVP